MLKSLSLTDMASFLMEPENFIVVVGGVMTSDLLTHQIDVWVVPFITTYIWKTDKLHQHRMDLMGVEVEYGRSVVSVLRFIIAVLIIYAAYRVVA